LDSNIKADRVTKSGPPGIPHPAVRIVATPVGAEYLATGDRAVAATGFLGGQTVTLGQTVIAFPPFGDNFGAVTLTALDQQSIGQSKRMLLTITGKAANLDQLWNDTHTSLNNHWGHGPAQAEGIPATVTISNPNVKHVWALDATGARVKEVPITVDGGRFTFMIGPDDQTVWYEISE